MKTACVIFLTATMCSGAEPLPDVHLQRDDEAGELAVVVDRREIIVYQYGPQLALPHYWPIRSPSGKLLTVQHPEPYPHHRSLWIADRVQAEEAPVVDFYHCWKNYRVDAKPESGFRDFLRHRRFVCIEADGHRGLVEAELQWIAQGTRPILDEHRTLRVVLLGEGEYLVDLAWELRASRGAVKFLSDDVHYAWPYVRMHPQFSGEHGGTIVNDAGKMGQQGTDGQVARWIDYSNTVDGVTEGLAVLLYPDGEPHRWLTREYGTFGPRRADAFSGTQFSLDSGERLAGRVGILVHRGDAKSGRVAERYQEYVEDRM